MFARLLVGSGGGCLICVASRQGMGEETTRRLERITAPASTSSPSSDVSARIASIEIRQNEIASTLSEFAQSLNGESLNAAWWSLVAEAQKNRAATASPGPATVSSRPSAGLRAWWRRGAVAGC